MNAAPPPITTRARIITTLLASLIVAAGSSLRAQSSPKVAPEAGAETVRLNPFTVSTDRDVGFVAVSALAGGRLATDLAETPVAYSVQTREFLDALNLNDVNEALNWTVSATTTPDDGGGQLFGGTGSSTSDRKSVV